MNSAKRKLRNLSGLSKVLLLTAYLNGCSNDTSVTGNDSFTEDNLIINVKNDDNVFDNNNIIIDEAKALISKIELENEPSGQNEIVISKLFVINLNSTEAVNQLASTKIPSGTYNKIKFNVHKPEDNETPPDPEFKEGNSGNQRYSVIIKGRYNGSSFVFKSRKSANIALNFPDIINIQETMRNITLIINSSQWFKNGNDILNPSDPQFEDAINENIKNSFKRAFKDDDRNGLPDYN